MALRDSPVDDLRKYAHDRPSPACITGDASRELSKLSNGIINRSPRDRQAANNGRFDAHYAFTTQLMVNTSRRGAEQVIC